MRVCVTAREREREKQDCLSGLLKHLHSSIKKQEPFIALPLKSGRKLLLRHGSCASFEIDITFSVGFGCEANIGLIMETELQL